MARIVRKSKVGQLTGKLGDVVTGEWNGITYVRDVPKKSTRPPSQAQLEQRARFALLNSFMRKITQYANIGFKEFAIGKTPTNIAITMNSQHLITGTYPDYSIDITKLILSSGTLSGLVLASVKSEQAGVITLEWKANTTRGYAQANDELLVMTYEATTGDVEVEIRVAQRSDGSFVMELDDYIGETLHVFASFVSKDGQRVSNSEYLGTVTVTG